MHVPGVGMSHAGKFLRDQHVPNFVVSDINAKAMQYQMSLGVGDHFQAINLLDFHKLTSLEKSDVVIDSGVINVFLANPGLPVQQAVQGIHQLMKPNGILICFSMNNVTMLPHLKHEFANVAYTFIRAPVASAVVMGKRRLCSPDSVSRQDISLWVCTDQKDDEFTRTCTRLNADVCRAYFGVARLADPTRRDIANDYAQVVPDRFFIANTIPQP